MDLMWFSWMMLRTSGLSMSTQYSTSKIPAVQKFNSSFLVYRSSISYIVLNGRHVHVIPEEASRRSSLLTSQSRLSQNNAQLERFPRMREAVRWTKRGNEGSVSCILVCCLSTRHHLTQELIEQVDNLLPGLGRFLASKFREVSSGVVHVQPVDTLQHDGDHSLKTITPGFSVSSLLCTIVSVTITNTPGVQREKRVYHCCNIDVCICYFSRDIKKQLAAHLLLKEVLSVAEGAEFGLLLFVLQLLLRRPEVEDEILKGENDALQRK